MGFVERGSTKHMMSDSENDKLSTEIGRPNQVEKEPANVGWNVVIHFIQMDLDDLGTH